MKSVKAILNFHGFRKEMWLPDINEVRPEIYIPFTEPLGIAMMVSDAHETGSAPTLKRLVFELIDRGIDPFDGTPIVYYQFRKLED